mgnify:CR=1 FL=1
MKYLLYGLLFAISIPAGAQQIPAQPFNCMWETPEWPIETEHGYHSTNGSIHTPRGELNVLVLFVGFTDITETILPNAPNDINHWPYNEAV